MLFDRKVEFIERDKPNKHRVVLTQFDGCLCNFALINAEKTLTMSDDVTKRVSTILMFPIERNKSTFAFFI